jgi:hypothetical protein
LIYFYFQDLGPILGGVFGGIVVIAIVGFILFYLNKKNKYFTFGSSNKETSPIINSSSDTVGVTNPLFDLNVI